MKRLPLPAVSIIDVLNLCKTGIGVADLRSRVEAGYVELSQLAVGYESAAGNGELFTIPPLQKTADGNTVLAAGLTKNELIKLYDYYLRDPQKPGRAIYDSLLLAAADKCPFCGGIGRPRNLDHFTPKAFFPQFSITPANLVPACRDCNMDGKGQGFPETENKQIIHPYLDREHFFNDQWVRAKVNPGNPCSVEYFVSAPAHWSVCDKERVNCHFHDFDLAKRYSIQAAEELTTIITQRRGVMSRFSPAEFSQHLSELLNASLFMNHWKRVMYQCLSADQWFCSVTF